ncbi:MAG: hypothetical protein WBC18_00820 [Ottowia sp.]|uniref:hypothetical protein n=1 Tax=Ottowia sp. TaxID=1898956 RepID=UPI003C75B0B3
MNDIEVKCTRCRHACMESEWLDVPSKRFSGCTERTCPRCGCKSYYDMTPQVAWCWASGLIEIGDQAPADQVDGSGPIVIARGPRHALNAHLGAWARHGQGRSAGKLLVPGVPEADTQREKGDALGKWLAWCSGSRAAKRNGVTLTQMAAS